jgi:hypothetical protein
MMWCCLAQALGSDAPLPIRAAAIVRDRSHISNRGNAEAGGLKSAHRRFATRTRPAGFHFQHAHAVLLRLPSHSLRSHLRGEGVDLRDPLKPCEPADDQAMVFPCSSVIVTMVLLKLE